MGLAGRVFEQPISGEPPAGSEGVPPPPQPKPSGAELPEGGSKGGGIADFFKKVWDQL